MYTCETTSYLLPEPHCLLDLVNSREVASITVLCLEGFGERDALGLKPGVPLGGQAIPLEQPIQVGDVGMPGACSRVHVTANTNGRRV